MGNVRAELRAAGLLSSTTISHISTENLFRERRRICLREITFYDAFDTIPVVLVNAIVKGCDSYFANHKSVQPEKRNSKQGPLVFFALQSNWLIGRDREAGKDTTSHHFSPESVIKKTNQIEQLSIFLQKMISSDQVQRFRRFGLACNHTIAMDHLV